MQFMTKDRVEEGLPVLHTSAAVFTYICRCSNFRTGRYSPELRYATTKVGENVGEEAECVWVD
jgi:hypothetical protein